MEGTVFYPVKFKKVNKVASIDIEDWINLSKYKHTPCPTNGNPEHLRLYYNNYKKRTSHLIHRLIMDCPKGMQVDHINHNGLDNRKKNLRIVTNAQNQQNGRGQRNASSIFKGVCWYKNECKWRAKVRKNKKDYHCGLFLNEKEAALAYNIKAKELFGEYAYLNKI